MKIASIPAVDVDPELRVDIEALPQGGETVSEFAEASVRATAQRGKAQAEFIARGLRSLKSAKRSGDSVNSELVLGH
jgi:hypothetical protein